MKENLDAAKSIIDSVSPSIWVAIFNILALYGHWLTAIYLIAPDFYNHTPLFIFLIVGFVLATQWYISSFLISISMVASTISDWSSKPKKKSGSNTEMPPEYMVAVVSLSVLGGLVAIWYLFGWQFRYLAIVPNALLYVLSYKIMSKVSEKLAKEEIDKTENAD